MIEVYITQELSDIMKNGIYYIDAVDRDYDKLSRESLISNSYFHSWDRNTFNRNALLWDNCTKLFHWEK